MIGNLIASWLCPFYSFQCSCTKKFFFGFLLFGLEIYKLDNFIQNLTQIAFLYFSHGNWFFSDFELFFLSFLFTPFDALFCSVYIYPILPLFGTISFFTDNLQISLKINKRKLERKIIMHWQKVYCIKFMEELWPMLFNTHPYCCQVNFLNTDANSFIIHPFSY